METLGREEVRQRLQCVCKQLMALVAGSYGPLGKTQLLQANAQCPDALTATSVAERYLASLNVGDCPVANAYFHILKSKVLLVRSLVTEESHVWICTNVGVRAVLVVQVRNHADAGLFLAGLSASLQLEIQEGKLTQVPHRVVNKGLQLVLDWSLEYLEAPACPVRVAVNWSSATSISAVIRGIVSSKSTTGVDEATMDTVVIPLVIQAFVSVFAYVAEFPNEAIPVQLVFAPGQKSIARSEVWKQTVLLDLPWPNRGKPYGAKRAPLSPPICNVRVALFNITIDPLIEIEEQEPDGGASVTHAGSLSSFRLEALRQVGDRLERLGATAVLSQKIIPKYLQSYLAAKGIFTLDRLSAVNIRGVQMLSGATILSDWRINDSVISTSLGFLSLITTQTLGSKKYVRLHREGPGIQTPSAMDSANAHPVTTIVLTAPDRYAYDELSHVITTALKALARLIDDPYVVAGAGCMEIHLAALLRRRARQLETPAPSTTPPGSHRANIEMQAARTLRQLSQTVTTFAECLENLVGRLCGSHAIAADREAMVEKIYEANNESLLGDTNGPKRNIHKLFGWNPRKRSAMPVLSYTCQEEEEPGLANEKIIVDARVLDVLQSKKDALVLAIESVSSLARISSVVRVP